jgi:formylglycine-generating enzyme required for sulfatase activity
VQGFFINRFEVSNAEYRVFLHDSDGYASDINWTEAGRRWRASKVSQASALIKPGDAE